MLKLNDTQLILLAAALQRDNRSLLPLPEALIEAGERVAKAIATLEKRGLVEERETSDPASAHRTDGELRYGMFLTGTGMKAIDGDEVRAPTGAPEAVTVPKEHGDKLPRQSKTTTIIALLQRNGGATIAELIEATGWLPHTTRAALTGLKKKGHAIERNKRGEVTCYRIVAAAAAA